MASLASVTREPPPRREEYVYFLPIQTRWHDNDLYGHVNNVVYYAYFDSVINRFLIANAGLDPHRGATIGLCVESSCRYFAPAAYPEDLEAGIAVAHLGNSSVRYALGIFRGTEILAAGTFTHVFVDRETRRPSPLPPVMREALATLTRVGATK